MKQSRGDRLFDAGVMILLVFALVVVLYPLYFVVIASFSDPSMVAAGKVILFPAGFSLEGYKKVLDYEDIWTGYRNTIFYTLGATSLSTIITLMAGYALSRKNFYGRSVIMAFMTFTMFFSGGLVPTYLLVDGLGLTGNPLVLIIMGCVSVYNIIISRTFLQSTIPDALAEAAAIDGCSTTRFFFSVVLPLSPALIAILILFNAVGTWNSWFNAMLYLRDKKYHPLALVLRNVLLSESKMNAEMGANEAVSEYSQNIVEAMRYAIIIVSTLPIMCIYPFLQKYFVKGVMVGSIKG